MQLNFRYLIGFLLLCLIVQEAHEIAHMLLNGMLQVCSGTRYFLYWEMCDADNKATFTALALIGPFVNFLLMTIGYIFLSNASSLGKKSIGFTLIMAANPLQRLQSIIFRGSDEIAAFKKIFAPVEPFKGIAVIAGLLLTLVFVVPALLRAWSTAKQKNGILVFLVCLVLPYVFTIAVQSAYLKSSLKSSLLESSGLLGFSWLIWLDIVLVLLFLPLAKYLKTLFNK